MQELTVGLLTLLIVSTSKRSILSLHDRTTLLSHLLTCLFTFSIPPTSSSSAKLDPLRAHLVRRLPAFACQTQDSKAALVRALVPSARHVLTSEQCFVSTTSTCASTAAKPASGADAAKALCHCVLGLLLLPLVPGSGGGNAPAAAKESSSQANGQNDEENPNSPIDEDSRDIEEELAKGVATRASPEPTAQRGVKAGVPLESGPEVWLYDFMLQCLEEAVVSSESVKSCKVDKYIRQLLRSLRAESVPFHALSVPQARKVKVCDASFS